MVLFQLAENLGVTMRTIRLMPISEIFGWIEFMRRRNESRVKQSAEGSTPNILNMDSDAICKEMGL